MKDKNLLIWAGNGLTYVLSAIQTDEVFQIVEFALSIVLTFVLIAYRLWKWYKEAKADGKITADEIKDGLDIVNDGVNEIKDKLDKEDKKDGKDKQD